MFVARPVKWGLVLLQKGVKREGEVFLRQRGHLVALSYNPGMGGGSEPLDIILVRHTIIFREVGALFCGHKLLNTHDMHRFI